MLANAHNTYSRSLSFIVVLIVALIAVHTFYALTFYFPGIYADQWDLVPKVGLYLSGEPWLKNMLSVHVDHLHTTSQLMMTVMAKWTNWHPVAELSLILIINVASFLLLFKFAVKPLLGFGNKQSTLIVIAIVSLYYSLAQAGNLLWTWQLSVHNCVFGVVLSLVLLTRNHISNSRFILAVLAGLFATFSFSCGVLIWPVGFVLLLLNHQRPVFKQRLLAGIWLLISFAVIMYFASAFAESTEKIQLSIINLGLFLLNALGTPYAYFSHDLTIVAAVLGLLGALLVAVRLVAMKKTMLFDSPIVRLAIGFMLFSLGALLLIALGRLDFGLEQARSFRYIAFSQFFWIGFLMLLAVYLTSSVHDKQPKIKLHTSLLVCVLLLTVVNGLKIGRAEAGHALQYRNVLVQFQQASESERDQFVSQFNYLPHKSLLTQRLDILKKHRLSMYSNTKAGVFGQSVIDLFSANDSLDSEPSQSN